MKTEITENEKLQLIGLKTLAIEQNKKLADIRDSIQEILGETEECGWADDFAYDDNTTIEKVLKVNKIKVINP